jgi:hypothetical protein
MGYAALHPKSTDITGTYHLGDNLLILSGLAYYLTFKMEVALSSETLVYFCVGLHTATPLQRTHFAVTVVITSGPEKIQLHETY